MNRIILIAAVVLGLAAAGAYWVTQKSGSTPIESPASQTATGDIDTSGIVEMTMGAEDAKVTLIEYASFTCPYCARFHESQFRQLKAEYIDTDKIYFVYRDVYFDRLGLWATMVARCGGPEKFFGISDLLYNQQRDWIGSGDPVEVTDNLRRIGKVAGLSDGQLDACLADDEKARALVALYNRNRTADNVDSTPMFLINGKKYGNMDYADLKALIDEQLAE